tara:strand:+ start:362 stop:898 length:537 start_codon:yes stop_codon:yes gene_type:complete
VAGEKETISFKANPKDLKNVYAAFRTLTDEASTELKSQVTAISAWTAAKIQVAAGQARYMPIQAERVAQSVRANKDRIPNVTVGGSKKNFSGGAAVGEVLFGSEFGAEPYLARRKNGSNLGANSFGTNNGRRFPPMSPPLNGGNEGYWIFPTLRREQPYITSAWTTAVENVLNNWSKN